MRERIRPGGSVFVIRHKLVVACGCESRPGAGVKPSVESPLREQPNGAYRQAKHAAPFRLSGRSCGDAGPARRPDGFRT